MSLAPTDFIGALHQAAVAAQQDEIEFRNSVADGIARRERARQFAFRRLELARVMLAAAQPCKTEEEAVKQQIAALKSELGWHADTGARPRICEAWSGVARSVWRNLQRSPQAGSNPESASVGDAMLAFEAWYETELGQPFLALLDHEIPEMPVVEF